MAAADGVLLLRRDGLPLAAGKRLAEETARQRGRDEVVLLRRGMEWRGRRRDGAWEWRLA